MKFEDVENARIAYKTKLSWFIAIIVGAFAIVVIIAAIAAIFSNGSILWVASLGASMPIFFIMIMVAIFLLIFATKKENTIYKKAYKAYFVERVLAQTFTDLQYSHELGIDKGVLNATQMINTGDRYHSNDLTTGKYKNVAFTQADVHIETESTDSDGNTTYTTIFRGRFMIFEFPKKFNFRLEVVSKFFGAKRVPEKDPQTGRKFEKFEVESPDFNKKFKIYAEDGFEAFYLLDPAFIDSIEKLGNTYQKKMVLGFIDNKLYVGLNDGKDSFEPPQPFKAIDEKEELAKVAESVKVVTDFVDELSLDRKIFS